MSNKLNSIVEIIEYLSITDNIAKCGNLLYKIKDNKLLYYSVDFSTWKLSTGPNFNDDTWEKYKKPWYEKPIPKGGVLVNISTISKFIIVTEICENGFYYRNINSNVDLFCTDDITTYQLVEKDELKKLLFNFELLEDIV